MSETKTESQGYAFDVVQEVVVKTPPCPHYSTDEVNNVLGSKYESEITPEETSRRLFSRYMKGFRKVDLVIAPAMHPAKPAAKPPRCG